MKKIFALFALFLFASPLFSTCLSEAQLEQPSGGYPSSESISSVTEDLIITQLVNIGYGEAGVCDDNPENIKRIMYVVCNRTKCIRPLNSRELREWGGFRRPPSDRYPRYEKWAREVVEAARAGNSPKGYFAWSFKDLRLGFVKSFIRERNLKPVYKTTKCRGGPDFGFVIFDK